MIYIILSLFIVNLAIYTFFAIFRHSDKKEVLKRLDSNHFLLVNLSEVLSSLVEIKGISDYFCIGKNTPYGIYLTRSKYEIASYDKTLGQLSTQKFSEPVRNKYREILERQADSIDTLRSEIKRVAKMEFPEIITTQLSA